MSHIPGSVQAFLTLFILGVQAALSLHVIGNCKKVFDGNTFLYQMSYNIMLLLLILCLCPLIYKSQRNYKEGKYFSISAVLITLCWCFWTSCYRVLNDSWKDPLICFAMVSTAAILQGVVFVSRTYLMTVSSTRNKLRNNLPHLNERNGVLDIYRADARQVYDCVNVAAINAISVARAGIATTDLDDDIYNYPTLPRDEELNFEIQTNSSNQTDKVSVVEQHGFWSNFRDGHRDGISVAFDGLTMACDVLTVACDGQTVKSYTVTVAILEIGPEPVSFYY